MAKVLVIESEASVAQSLNDALAREGHQVIMTGDGNDALKVARDRRPDLIILCVELSRGSGYSVCNKLKKDNDLAGIPLILTSSQATDETFEQHKKLRTRAEAYLKKPYAMSELVKLTGQYLGKRRAASDEVEVSLDDVAVESGGGGGDEAAFMKSVGAEPTSSIDDDLEMAIRPSARPAVRPQPAASQFRSATTSLVADAEGEKARVENRQLRQKLQQMEKTLQEKELEFNDRLLEESGRARDAVDVRKKLAQLEREVSKYQQTADRATQEAERAKQELSRTRNEVGGVDKERQVLADKIGQLVDKVKSLAAERDKLQARVEQMEHDMSNLRVEVENAGKVKEKAKKAVDIAMQLLDETGLVN